MPVYAMKAIAKKAHEKTDQLFIYTFVSPAQGELQIVANKDNAYDVGDVAGIALLGTHLPGVTLKPRKVFGYDSAGMAMGKVDAPLDADLSATFDADAPEQTYTVQVTVDVTARYADDAEGLARKALKQGKGAVVSVAPQAS